MHYVQKMTCCRRIGMNNIDVIASRLSLIFPEISGKFTTLVALLLVRYAYMQAAYNMLARDGNCTVFGNVIAMGSS